MGKMYSFFEVTIGEVNQHKQEDSMCVTVELEVSNIDSNLSFAINNLSIDTAAGIVRQFMYMRNVAPTDENGRPQIYVLLERDEKGVERIRIVGTAKPFGASKNIWFIFTGDSTLNQAFLDNPDIILHALLDDAKVVLL